MDNPSRVAYPRRVVNQAKEFGYFTALAHVHAHILRMTEGELNGFERRAYRALSDKIMELSDDYSD